MIELATFTAAEAAHISGVNVALQRDWRRREILPRVDGQARFDAFGVAELMLLDRLSRRSIGPQSAKAVAGSCVAAMVSFALTERSAYDGDVESLHIERTGPKNLAAFLEWQGLRGDDLTTEEVWDFKARYLRERVLTECGYSPRVSSWCAWLPDGTAQFFDALDGVEPVGGWSRRGVGAIVLLPLAALGDEIAARAGRPLVTVTLSEQMKEPSPLAVAAARRNATD